MSSKNVEVEDTKSIISNGRNTIKDKDSGNKDNRNKNNRNKNNINKKKCSFRMIGYELRNINGNFMTHFFGIVFPNIMSLLFSTMIGKQVPDAARPEVTVSVVICMALIMPMSIMFLGYGSLYSQEVEREIPQRMHLFGFSEKSLITAKIIVHLLFLTGAMLLYGVIQTLLLDIPKPALSSLLILLGSLYLIGALFLVIVHSMANIFRRFSVTFGVAMSIYFLLMMLTGMMGISTDELPVIWQRIARTLPMTYISNDFAGFWQGGSYNFMPYIQSCIFLAAFTGILAMYAQHRGRRVRK